MSATSPCTVRHGVVPARGSKALATAVDDQFTRADRKARALQCQADEMGDGPTTRLDAAVDLTKNRRRQYDADAVAVGFDPMAAGTFARERRLLGIRGS